MTYCNKLNHFQLGSVFWPNVAKIVVEQTYVEVQELDRADNMLMPMRHMFFTHSESLLTNLKLCKLTQLVLSSA